MGALGKSGKSGESERPFSYFLLVAFIWDFLFIFSWGFVSIGKNEEEKPS